MWWDSQAQMIRTVPDRAVEGYPDWTLTDCHCCQGLQWGGEEPRECPDCGGNGHVFKHRPSGALALYPGGPFCGHA